MMLALLFLALPCDALLPPLPDVFATAERAMGGNVSLVLVQPPEKLVPTAKQIDEMEHPEVRLHYFAFLFLLVYGMTVAIGTALLSMARKGSYNELSRRETKTEDANSSPTSGTLSASQLQQVVATAFAGTLALCLAATMWSLATGRISRRWGLDWEMYVALFTLSNMWLLAQAAWMARTRTGPFATTAFLEASMGGTCPIISDVYDSLKDVMVAGLCMKSDSYILKFLGVASIVWLLGVHVGFLMNNACIVELAGSYAPVLMLTTASKTDSKMESQGTDGCCAQLAGAWQRIAPMLYKQVTPTKRRLLVWENIFQAIVGIAYMKLEGGSAMVAILNLAIPAVQIGCTFVFYDCLKRQVAPYLGKRLSQAAADGNELVDERLLAEADFENDVELFIAVAPHIKHEPLLLQLFLAVAPHIKHEPLLQRVIDQMDFKNEPQLFVAVAPDIKQELVLQRMIEHMNFKNNTQLFIAVAPHIKHEPLLQRVVEHMEFEKNLERFCAMAPGLNDYQGGITINATDREEPLGDPPGDIRFQRELGDKELRGLFGALQHLQRLSRFKLKLSKQLGEEEVRLLLDALQHFTDLKDLELPWQVEIRSLEGGEALLGAVAKMTRLRRLKLFVEGSFRKSSLASTLRGLKDLEELALGPWMLKEVEYHESVTDYAELSTTLGQLVQLHTLHLSFDSSMEKVKKLLQGLPPLLLRRLGLTLWDKQQVKFCAEALRRIGAPELRLGFDSDAQPTAQLGAALAQQPRQRLIFGFGMYSDDLRATADHLRDAAACLAELPQLPRLELRVGRFGSRADAVAAAPELGAALRRAATEQLVISHADPYNAWAEELRAAVAKEVPELQTQVVQKEKFDW